MLRNQSRRSLMAADIALIVMRDSNEGVAVVLMQFILILSAESACILIFFRN